MAVLQFALKSLVRRPITALLLLLGSTVALTLPTLASSLGSAFQRQLVDRSAGAPLIIGGVGSATDLTLHALYFRVAPPRQIRVQDWQTLGKRQDLMVVPLLSSATCGGRAVVGTNGEYFTLRGLRLTAGGPLADIADCVVGAQVARSQKLVVESKMTTDSGNLFAPAAGVGTELRVVGVLAATGTADDDAIFVSLPTAWYIAGLGHSHAQPATSPTGRPPGSLTSVATDRKSLIGFHFHGNRADFPLSALLVIPRSDRARLQVLGSFLANPPEGLQVVKAEEVIDRLSETAFRVTSLIQGAALILTLATVFLTGAIVALTLQIRRHEIRLMDRLGLTRARIVTLLATEFGLVITAAMGLAWSLTRLAQAAGPSVIRQLLDR